MKVVRYTNAVTIETDDGRGVATCGPFDGQTMEDAVQVATKLAASDDLLAALEYLTGIVERRFEGLEIVALVPRELRTAVEQALVAIRKAKGEDKEEQE